MCIPPCEGFRLQELPSYFCRIDCPKPKIVTRKLYAKFSKENTIFIAVNTYAMKKTLISFVLVVASCVCASAVTYHSDPTDSEAATEVYVGPDMPTDPNIKVWINTAEEGTGVVPVLPRVSTITLPKASWSGSSAPYYQTVSINTVTSATKIELNPTVAQIVSLQNDDIALMAENDNGTVKVYSFGGKPSSDMTIQVTLTEVSYV